MKKILLFIFINIIGFACSAQVISPEQISFRNASGRFISVVDPAGYLSPAIADKIDKELEQLRLDYTVEVVVVLPPEIGEESPAEWCEQVFTKSKIGKKDKDNGLLVMISPGSKVSFILAGYGMEGVFTDAVCTRLCNTYITPAMREGNVNQAVENIVSQISQIIQNPAVAEELKSSQQEGLGVTLDPEVFWTFVQFIAVIFLLISFVLFIYYSRKARRLQTHYEKAEYWRSKLTLLFILGLCSLGTGLIFFILGYVKYRSWRMRPLPCSTCGHKMKRLPEDKDNELLSDSQDFEEKLKTVDYDVWECPECGTIERFPFKSSQKKYTECPNCHTIAMGLESDSVVKPATVRSEGQGVKVYGCKYCHHRLKKPYVIPRKEDNSAAAAVAAGAILGAASRNRGGSGGSGGFGGFGGFGGGATGGGGGGSRW